MPPDGLAERAAAIQESVTLAVSARAKELRAAGEPVIGFGAGEPDFPTPEHVVDAARAAAREPGMHQYSPAGGIPELRAAIAEKTKRDSGLDVDASEVLVSNGGKHALYNAFQVLIDPGDEVLLTSPYWVTYPEQIRLAGGVPVVVPTSASTGFRASLDRLDAALTERTKLLLFVSPSNPTGAVYTPEEVTEIGRWAAERGIWVLTDEIYEHLVYGDAEHVSMPVVAPDLRDRCIVVNGVSKAYAMTGWRIGWMIGPPAIVSAAVRLQSHVTSNASNVAQRAALAALEGPQGFVAEMRASLDRRRRLTVERLQGIDGMSCPEPLGAFYAFPDAAERLGRDIRGRRVETALGLAEALLEEAKVAVVPGEAFGAPTCLRLSYAVGDADLIEGLERLADALA